MASSNATYYKERINFFIAVSPYVSLTGTSKFNEMYMKFHVDNYELLKKIGYFSFMGDYFTRFVFAVGCQYNLHVCNFCANYVSQETGKYHHEDRQKIYYSHYPVGSSLKAVLYNYQQLQSGSGDLFEFDEGPEKNLELYG